MMMAFGTASLYFRDVCVIITQASLNQRRVPMNEAIPFDRIYQVDRAKARNSGPWNVFQLFVFWYNLFSK